MFFFFLNTVFPYNLKVVVGVLAGTSIAYILVHSPSSGLCMIRIKERDTTSKLDLLLKMNYYSHAIMLAKQAQYSPEEINKMVLMFADHKYKKCDWEGAITQYVALYSLSFSSFFFL